MSEVRGSTRMHVLGKPHVNVGNFDDAAEIKWKCHEHE